jgi:hypothetical protein
VSSLSARKRFLLHDKQKEARLLMGGLATHFMAFGGSRSGKTFLIVRMIIIRAMKSGGSSHVILRHRLNHLKASIIGQTVPDVLEKCFPHLLDSWHADYNKSDYIWTLPNGARIVFGGLDDAQRTEKILGQEHATIYLNECSQIGYSSVVKAMTRLAQVALIDGTGTGPNNPPRFLNLRMFYDCNPPAMGHWTHLMFVKKQEPISKVPLINPADYVHIQMNPAHNRANLSEKYFQILDQLPENDRKRFRDGVFLANVDNALWDYATLEKSRVDPAEVDYVGRVVVAVDPSGAKGPEEKRNDEIGIVVAGLDVNGRGLVMEDATMRDRPEKWAAAALDLYDKYQADAIVAEINYGGDMVRAVIQAQRSNANVIVVTASRGKHVRAEPISQLYARQKIMHAGTFPELEEELVFFSSAGYQGARSPNRADACIWALTELMLDGEGYNLNNVA